MAQGIQVLFAEIAADDDDYYLNADFSIVLGHPVEAALNKGVPLNFVMEAEITRPRWYWFDRTVASTQSQYRLSYNALTQQYRVAVGSLFQNFATLNEAIQLLARIRNREMAKSGDLSKGQKYTAAIRLRLDTTQLPKPFQVTALGSRDWGLSSEWHRWTFTP